jgi:hypothetical protein
MNNAGAEFGSNVVTNFLYVCLLLAAILTLVANWRSALASEKSAKASEDSAKAAGRLSDDTRELLNATVAASQMTERHHRDNLRPVLVLDADLRVFDFKSSAVPKGMNDFDFHLDGYLRNIGGGPATAVELVLTPFGQTPQRLTVPRVIGPNSSTPVHVEWHSQTSGFRTDGDAWPYEAVLGYSNIAFTLKPGVTKQHTHSGYGRDTEVDNVRPTDQVDEVKEDEAR